MMPPPKAAAPWRNRIVRTGEEAPDQLLANPRNWRIHPRHQQNVLGGVLEQVGWVTHVIVNERTGHVVDGHARVGLAISRNEATVPVTYVDLSEAEEALVLATLDPISALAAADKDTFGELMRWVETDDTAVQQLLDDLQLSLGVVTGDDYTNVKKMRDAEIDRALWPWIKIQVAPETLLRWREFLLTLDGTDDNERINALIEKMDNDHDEPDA